MYTLRLTLPALVKNADIPHFAELFDSSGFSAKRLENHHKADWTLEWICEAKPSLDDAKAALDIVLKANSLEISSPTFELIETPDIDWLSHCYQQFPAFSVGPFFIYGSHHNLDTDGAIPDDAYTLQIDAATAFGSGEHGTTAGCLEAMTWLKDQGMCPWHVLDMGTGSGILAIAAWKLWKTPVLAVDNDAEAVRVTEKHRILNGVPDGKMNILSAVGDGFAAEIVQQRKPYELVIANILAGPLIEMAEDLASVVDDAGRVILSGILNEQADKVQAAYEAQNMRVLKTFNINGWTSFILQS